MQHDLIDDNISRVFRRCKTNRVSRYIARTRMPAHKMHLFTSPVISLVVSLPTNDEPTRSITMMHDNSNNSGNNYNYALLLPLIIVTVSRVLLSREIAEMQVIRCTCRLFSSNIVV